MADREDQSNLPPIPDGGLTESMPDWLRRPPAWRTLPDREVTAPEPEDAAELPEPDDSVIDPRTFLSDDDLPEWLRNLGPGRRVESPADPEPPGAAAVTSSRVAEQPDDQPVPSTPARFVPAAPPVARLASAPRDATRKLSPQPPVRAEAGRSPAWQGAWVVAMLAALLVVAIAVIVVLVI